MTEQVYRKAFCNHYLQRNQIAVGTMAEFLYVETEDIHDFINGVSWDGRIATGFGYEKPDLNQLKDRQTVCKSYRAIKNLTQKQVAKKVGVSESEVALFERGLNHNPKIARFYPLSTGVQA